MWNKGKVAVVVLAAISGFIFGNSCGVIISLGYPFYTYNLPANFNYGQTIEVTYSLQVSADPPLWFTIIRADRNNQNELKVFQTEKKFLEGFYVIINIDGNKALQPIDPAIHPIPF